MGSSFKVSDELVKGAEKVVCKLYGQNCGTVNEARYNLFLTTTKSETNLPPSADSLKKHVLRANYQAAVHSKCLEQFPQCPSPKGHGWKIVEGELAIDWGDLPPAPSSLLELTHCSCKKTSCEKSTTGKGRCSCQQHGVPCTELCRCVDCENSVSPKELELDEEGSDED